MFRVKKLDFYLFKNFATLFCVTFFICLFILLMQFLWKYVDEMVGKGLEISVLSQFFFYSALSLVPMALPLAILLASLMTFGNLGEQLELLAIKAAGISLFRIMRPLIITIAFICVAAFFFANNVIPRTQVKLWTLIFSMRQKSPEIDIPENVFYSGITGYNIYVKEKDTKHNLLKKIMIYDLSKGFENTTVTVADSARLQFTEDKKFLVFTLYNGESFENLKDQSTLQNSQNIPYRRESFELKQTLIEFDANFTKVSESMMQGKYVTKNIVELEHAIDSINYKVDSLKTGLGKHVIDMQHNKMTSLDPKASDLNANILSKDCNAQTLYTSLSKENKIKAIKRAVDKMSNIQNEIDFKKIEIEDRAFSMRRHGIEWHRKFTLSFACLIFFFIGAPLGAIIRKGGLGTPVVISVLLFIVYYIIDNTGYKFGRDGVWNAFQGMWLSSAVLLPFGIFLTYKAATDSAILNADAYIIFWKKMTSKMKRKK